MNELTPKDTLDWLKAHQPLLLVTHVTPDGDGLGSEAALYFYLKKSGLEVSIFNQDLLPFRYEKFMQDGEFKSLKAGDKLEDKPKGVVILDTNDWLRIGKVGEILEKMGFNSQSDDVFFIDHHVIHEKGVNGYIRESACATGELVYDIIEEAQKQKGKQPSDMGYLSALGVYISILTDTGSFQFRRTTKKIHDIAGICLVAGVVPYEVYQQVYGSGSFNKLLFEAEVLQSTKMTDCGRVVYVKIPNTLRKKYGMTIEDTQGLVGRLRMIRNIDISMLAREEENGIKVSLRAQGDYEVISIAQKFNGGGHRHAAGLFLKMTMEEAVEKVLEEILEYLGKIKVS